MQYLYATIIAQAGSDPKLEAADALIHAISSSAPGQIETSLLLVNAIQDVNMQIGAGTPLTLAANKGKVDMLEALLDRGADIELRTTWEGRTPLNSATMHCQEEAM
ncbi:ankyrin repeat protein [Penicillium longicatenatum]|nr:ankyrin repeat protein [Penicillium longicatenatum]